MSDDPQCGVPGPGDLECTRYGTDHDTHATYTRIDGERYNVSWFGCNNIGEPTEVSDE